MKNKDIKLPIIINGLPIYETKDSIRIQYLSGVNVVIPRLDNEHVDKIAATDKYILGKLQMQDIVAFLSKIGEFWSLNNSSHPLVNEAIENLALITGYSKEMAIREFNIIGEICSMNYALYDLMEYELGSRLLMDEWLPNGDVFYHTLPKGNILNYMVGNVPFSGIMSIIRCCLTKNRVLAKLPKREIFIVSYFILSMSLIDPDHPVTQAMNSFYWEAGDYIEESVVNISDVICVWGGEKVVNHIRSFNVSDLIIFGPKRSYALIAQESVEDYKVSLNLAHDISIYNQEACYCPQVVFVEGNSKAFMNNLSKSLKLYSSLLPKGFVKEDVAYHINRSILEAKYMENELISDGIEWNIIKITDISQIKEHPLSRVIYVLEINTLTDIYQYIDTNVQTVALSPWYIQLDLRDSMTLRGVSRITEIGLADAFRNGATHDNIYPLRQLVRWVCVERGLDFYGKYVKEGPIDTTLWVTYQKKHFEELAQKYS